MPKYATATNLLNSGLHVTEFHCILLIVVDNVGCIQFIPSLEYITLLPVPLFATATNLLNSGLHVTENQVIPLIELDRAGCIQLSMLDLILPNLMFIILRIFLIIIFVSPIILYCVYSL